MKFSQSECPGLRNELEQRHNETSENFAAVMTRRRHAEGVITGYDVPLLTDLGDYISFSIHSDASNSV